MIWVCHGVEVKGLNKDSVADSHLQRTLRVSWPKVWWRGILLVILAIITLIIHFGRTLLASHGFYIDFSLGFMNHVARTAFWNVFEFGFYLACYLVMRRSINRMDGSMMEERAKYESFRWIFRGFLVYLLIKYSVAFYFRMKFAYDPGIAIYNKHRSLYLL